MRAGCHGELSKSCSGFLLHLAVGLDDDLGVGEGVTFLVIYQPACV